jgi:multiple sugar transport system permease protein
MTALFSLGFERNNIGAASAASVLLLLTTMGLTILTQFLTRRKTDR